MQRKIPNINFRDKLHSIPINKMKNVKSNVLYSIPCGCIVTLLLLGCSLLLNMIMSNSSCYATEEAIGDSTASMTLDTSDVLVNVTAGATGYASKSITINTNNTESYTLTITAPAVLKNEEANTTNTWSYAYGQDGNVESMSYTTFDGSTKQLETGIESDGRAKTLVFSSHFDEGLSTGHYKAEVTLGLTATPKAITYTLTLNNNGGSGGTASKTCTTFTDTCEIQLDDVVAPTKDGQIFLGWAESNTAMAADYLTTDTIAMTGDRTIYAVWRSSTFTLTFDGNSDDASNVPVSQSCTPAAGQSSCTVTIPADKPTRPGQSSPCRISYSFKGWQTEASSGTLYQLNDTITLKGDTVLYAKWGISVSTCA